MDIELSNNQSNFLFYTSSEGKVKIQVVLKNETVFMTQKAIAELFDVSIPTINEHLKNIFTSDELSKNSVIRKFRITASDGKNYNTQFYNLDAIISVGYRVNSKKATRFRQWATEVLHEYTIKGFAIDDERLKQGNQLFGKDYFDELIERIREIRASERRFYQKITDIYALSADYDKKSARTREFFATVQNKLHWAITGKTAAEIIYSSADATKLYMGLTSWKYAPDGKILKSDVTVAKNYLNSQHINELNRIVSAYLDLAENRAQRHIIMNMNDWIKFLHNFLELSNYPILKDKGKISALQAKIKAESEYDKYRVIQDNDYISDFDREIKRIKGNNT